MADSTNETTVTAGTNEREWIRERALANGLRQTANEIGITRQDVAFYAAGFPVAADVFRKVWQVRRRIDTRAG